MKKSMVGKLFNLVLIFAIVFMNYSTVFALNSSTENQQLEAEDLFISEYIEGGSFNKAIEIFNGTGTSVNLSNYQLELYSNGATEASQTLALEGTLEHGDVLVLAHGNASETILAVTDIVNSAVINFNGDDAFVLAKNGETIDVLGEIGVREDYGKDKTLVRKSSISAPDANYDESQWDVYAKDTFAYLGQHIMDGVDPGEPGEPGDPGEPIDENTIYEARNLSDGTTVTVEGIVLANNTALSNGSQFTTYIQDDTAGINLFAYEQRDLPDLKKGDVVKVTGELDSYNGLKEIIPTTIEVFDTNQPLPEVQQISLEDLQDPAIAETYEGELVQVNGFINNIPESPAGGGYNVSLIDSDFNGTTLRVMENALDISEVQSQKWYNITAIVSQYNTYQLLPTEQSDIQLAEEQPDPPSAEGLYPAKVDRITDGDTIRIQDPVFGETRIRFVNMDTPETYPARNSDPTRQEINENQKHHGDMATQFINTLIQPGDEILLKVGDQPTDDYGRILAEVIRQEDDLNINLEMVKEGYAVSYFIPPFNEDVYPDYQAAVKEAKDAGLGIWNPDNPLLELPFAFRANDDQKGFLRYVGNSDTMEYVEPNYWEDVPVEKRIFFSSAEEAESYGYRPEGQEDENLLEVQILSMNDLHGKIDQEYSLDPDGDGVNDMYGRMDYTATAIKERELENENTLIVHAGDMIGGSSPVSGLLQDEPTVEIMEEIGFDVGTVGNHEFDEGLDELLRMVNGGDHPEGKGTEEYDGMNFPVLCANCVYEDSGEQFLDAYHIEEVDGVDIGFVGVNTTETVNMVMPSSLENVAFTDEVAAVNDAVDELTDQGVEAIIVLAHMPAYQNGESATGAAADLAVEVNDAVDIIFAAHNHQVNNAIVDNKLIVQASEYGKAFADVDIIIDRTTGDIVEKEAEIVFVNQSNYTPDEVVEETLNYYAELIAPIVNEVVGYNGQELTGSYTNGSDHGLGNLITDGMKWTMESDFAMTNGGGIRDILLEGPITWGELYNILPFGNTLQMFEIKGEDLFPILNEQLSQYGSDYSIAGFRYTFNPELEQVVDITLPDGTPIDKQATYTLTVNNYMGTSEGPIKDLGKNMVMGPEDIEAFVDYVKSLNSSESNPILYGPEGRISTTDDEPGDEEERPIVEVEPKKNHGTATVHTKDLKDLEHGVQVVINIYNEKKPRKLLLNKKQVDLLKEKEILLVVTNGTVSETIEMTEVTDKVLKVSLED
ncbi:5'-nucleotidase C-terminal domain-containing protein [Ornithinibacillus halophilus]|uniref:2',3'-cyclic-nucleotide 2'-phosphodiesterase/5'-or 3'-nucleotidase, 5'-nucleotidase family n=1 Tax=Ornithinibacillus halophilus TaxID=930117 RepID=A0A1M5KWC4_9BACI|nr:5'-nucleotidase C-terminal domain-containing protein [Ornithinibacillus halophilus]SHG57036.1 2',3'-cyclic-nucleotide 2'-phosphodiesterase/5'-or 3'-nucleotidase, 5'-nucleotidase family [Ornithinibacillus halophilus]